MDIENNEESKRSNRDMEIIDALFKEKLSLFGTLFLNYPSYPFFFGIAT